MEVNHHRQHPHHHQDHHLLEVVEHVVELRVPSGRPKGVAHSENHHNLNHDVEKNIMIMAFLSCMKSDSKLSISAPKYIPARSNENLHLQVKAPKGVFELS